MANFVADASTQFASSHSSIFLFNYFDDLPCNVHHIYWINSEVLLLKANIIFLEKLYEILLVDVSS